MAPADAEVVRSAGHDVIWAGSWDLDPGDPEVLRRAFVQDRVLVTLDKDFGALVFRRRMPHAGMIYLRNSNPLQFAKEVLRAIEVFGPELESRGIVVFRKDKIRLATSPDERA
jgi:predicted nuclease of predicted toxin-antitoxin system